VNIIKIIVQIGILSCIYLVGNFIQQTLGLFIPGSVIGMILLFILLMTNVIHVKWIEAGSAFLNKYLAILFVPATVGIVNYLHLFAGKGFLLFVVVMLSTILVMGGSGLVSEWALKRKQDCPE